MRTENHRYLCRTLSDLSSSSPSPQSTSPSQVYLVTTVPLFSLPQLSSSSEVKHFLTLILPYVLPVAHIGMVIIITTRPKPAYGRQGLDWIVGPGYSFVVFSTNREIQLTSLIQKTTRHRQGVQLTSFDPKNVSLPKGGSNWPPLIQKTWCHQQGDLADLLWCKKRDRYQQGGPTDLLDV